MAMTLLQAAQTGDRLVALETLRDVLADLLDEVRQVGEPRDVTALALRFTDVLSQIDDVPTSRQASAADEIAQRRAARRGGGAAGSARSPRSG